LSPPFLVAQNVNVDQGAIERVLARTQDPDF